MCTSFAAIAIEHHLIVWRSAYALWQRLMPVLLPGVGLFICPYVVLLGCRAVIIRVSCIPQVRMMRALRRIACKVINVSHFYIAACETEL